MSDEVPVIKVGSKNIMNYTFAVLTAFQEADDVMLRGVGSSINTMERIIRLFSVFGGFTEVNRNTERDGDAVVLVCRIRAKK